MTYANNASIPYVAIIGEAEAAAGTVTVKNMAEGTQVTVPVSEAASHIS